GVPVPVRVVPRRDLAGDVVPGLAGEVLPALRLGASVVRPAVSPHHPGSHLVQLRGLGHVALPPPDVLGSCSLCHGIPPVRSIPPTRRYPGRDRNYRRRNFSAISIWTTLSSWTTSSTVPNWSRFRISATFSRTCCSSGDRAAN